MNSDFISYKASVQQFLKLHTGSFKKTAQGIRGTENLAHLFESLRLFFKFQLKQAVRGYPFG